MLKCEETRELMSLFIDNELTDAEQAVFNKHITTCSQCKQELKLLQDIVAVFNTVEEVELPDDFKEQLHGKLVKTKKSIQQTNPPWYRNWRTYSGIAACILIAVSLKTLGYSPFSTSHIKQAEKAYVADANLEESNINAQMTTDDGEVMAPKMFRAEMTNSDAAPEMDSKQITPALNNNDMSGRVHLSSEDRMSGVGIYRDIDSLTTYYGELILDQEQREQLLKILQNNVLLNDISYQDTDDRIIVIIDKKDYDNVVKLVHTFGFEGELVIVKSDVTEEYNALLTNYDVLIQKLNEGSISEQTSYLEQIEIVTNEILDLENKIEKYTIVIKKGE